MVPDLLVVNNQVVDVLDTWEYNGTTVAKVQGGHIGGFVEVPENPKEPSFQVYCEECGHYEELPDGRTELVDFKANTVNNEGSARVLADIHELKSGHNPDIRQVAD